MPPMPPIPTPVRTTRRVRALAAPIAVALSVLVTLAGCSTAGGHTPDHPAIAEAWARAWNGPDPAALAALFTADATYRDLAVAKTSAGRDGVTSWKRGTNALIDQAHITVEHTFADGDSVAIQGTYTGHITGAPRPFRLPMSTVLRMRGDLVVDDTDYYNLADLLRQSGLPPTWTPPAT